MRVRVGFACLCFRVWGLLLWGLLLKDEMVKKQFYLKGCRGRGGFVDEDFVIYQAGGSKSDLRKQRLQQVRLAPPDLRKQCLQQGRLAV